MGEGSYTCTTHSNNVFNGNNNKNRNVNYQIKKKQKCDHTYVI
jgi:hypothetical protein